MTVTGHLSLFYGLTALKYDTLLWFQVYRDLAQFELNRMRNCQKILKATHQSVYTGIETIFVDENDTQTAQKIE